MLDTRPRRFTPAQIEIMKKLAEAAQNELTNCALNESLREARQAREAAETADRAKSQFLAVMSHEVRTPLNGIIGIADLLAETKVTPEQQEYINIISTSGNSLLGLINDVLDFSKMEAGKLELENAPLDLRRFLKDTLALHLHAAKSKGIGLHSEVNAAVPATVWGDVFRLRQILLNLVGNALKFTKSGEIRVGVAVEDAGKAGSWLVFCVRDTGIGIPAEAQSRLFEAFRQADSSVCRTHGGTGLGLSICKQLVELMGGKIWLESSPGRGSTFLFSIPLRTEEAEAREDIPRHAPVPPAPSGPRRQLKVLVVDDNAVNQRVAGLFLNRLGCLTESVGSGAACLQELEKASYDVILMDMEMPEMNGCETTGKIRARPGKRGPSVPWIVALSANNNRESAVRCAEAGMNDYLTKPLRLESLSAALERFERRSP